MEGLEGPGRLRGGCFVVISSSHVFGDELFLDCSYPLMRVERPPASSRPLPRRCLEEGWRGWRGCTGYLFLMVFVYKLTCALTTHGRA